MAASGVQDAPVAAQDDPSQDSRLRGVAEEVLAAHPEAGRWRMRSEGVWTYLTPADAERYGQGWKLHVSATMLSAEQVLRACLPALLAGRSAFKFAPSTKAVIDLNTRHTPRGNSGKFLTVYPAGDDEAVRLAEELDRATDGMAGPRILSDRAYRPGSLVHYRYGAFAPERRLGADGFYSWVIFDPEGNAVPDRRTAVYWAPDWVTCPFPQPQPAQPNGAGNGGGVLLADRFRVTEAIRHTNKGGVYRATDTRTGVAAIIKEARPHVATDEWGRDVRDLLRAEAAALRITGPAGMSPELLEEFEQSGHVFLAEQEVPGTALQHWVTDGIRDGGWRRHVPGAVAMARKLAELMRRAHAAGLILRDFNPNNVVVTPDGEPLLIDLELTVRADEPPEHPFRAATHCYGAPEQFAAADPAFTADYYSLGATVCQVVCGDAPYLLPDEPAERPMRERMAEWLAVRGEALELPAGFEELVLGLMDDDPAERWTAERAESVLAGLERTPPAGAPARAAHTVPPLDGELWHQAVGGAVDYLLAAMTPEDPERAWPVSMAEGATDPATVQLGAAGVLGVLARCYEHTADPRLPEAIASGGNWLLARANADAGRAAGLYFGAAGVAWALSDAGEAIGDERLAAGGRDLAATLEPSAESADATHGTAGTALAQCHLWWRTGDERLLAGVHACADSLIAARTEEDSGVSWGTPAAETSLPGGRYHGFAHGTAGAAAALLSIGAATGRADCLDLARRAGDSLLSQVVISGGIAMWGAGPGDPPTAPYWCHGASGIATFLVRLYRVTGDERYLQAAEGAAAAVLESAWRGVLGQCHGLAGNGEFLLDMRDLAPAGEPYAAMAERLARVIFASRAYRDGNLVFHDEHGNLSASWADGMSGILSFWLRLRCGGARMWMADEALAGEHER
jgi:hypothetical protein